eukprot:gene8293-biopygen14600
MHSSPTSQPQPSNPNRGEVVSGTGSGEGGEEAGSGTGPGEGGGRGCGTGPAERNRTRARGYPRAARGPRAPEGFLRGLGSCCNSVATPHLELQPHSRVVATPLRVVATSHLELLQPHTYKQ